MADDGTEEWVDFIPKVFEGYATSRVVWFSHAHGATERLDLNDLLTVKQAQGERDWSGGVLLETEGQSDMISIGWHKDTVSPCGVFQMVLKPRKDYLRLIRPDDLLIWFSYGDKGGREFLVSVISVDTVGETRSVSSKGATVANVQIQGRDLGKVLMETPTIYDPTFGGPTMVRFYSEFVRAFGTELVQGGPSQVVQTMLSIFFSLQQNFITLAMGKEIPQFSVGNSAARLATQNGGETRPLAPWQFPGHPTASLMSLLDIDSFVQKTMVGALAVPGTVLQDAHNLWSLCEMYANRCVNEFFIDVRDFVPGYEETNTRLSEIARRYLNRFGQSGGRDVSAELNDTLLPQASIFTSHDKSLVDTDIRSAVALVHRQLPYDTASFLSLPACEVYATEIWDSSLTLSTHDVKNLFRMRMPGVIDGGDKSVDSLQVFGLTMNRDSIRKHGIRWFEGESIYPWITIEDGTVRGFAFEPTFNYYMSLFTTWYAYNERMFAGSITMRYRPDIRVGTRLTLYRSRNNRVQTFDFYVQSVSHNWSAQPGASRTSVQLVRGVQRSHQFTYDLDNPFPEEQLFWNENGRQLPNDPYEVVIAADRIARSQ